MPFREAQYFPVPPQFLFLLAGALAILLILIQIRVLRYVYMQLGISPGSAVLLLLASLLGSYVNIPIAMIGAEPLIGESEVSFYGMRYVIPHVIERPGTLLAINVGGAVIPTILSLYLLSKNRLWGRGALAALCVAAVSYSMAQPVRGVGIALPIFVAPIAAAVVAAIISWRDAAPLAYAGGSLGVLIGADLLNYDKLAEIGAPILSIGGAGTFDGIFLTGVMAVLLASLTGVRRSREEESGVVP
jgi:uncharacterized membrane protein